MAKVQIKELISNMAGDFLRENGLELYNTQFKKEGRDWYLRVFIDKAQAPENDKAQAPADGETQTDQNAEEEEEEYVSTDDCEKVSRYLSEKLDEADPIQQNYFLEVSSPGMDRELFAQKDYDRFAGRRVEVKLYQNFENSKEYEGTLIGLIDGKVVIRDDDEREMAFPLEQVAKTNLAVVF